MTTQEFSSEFDILYNNIMSNQAPGLDEYEKSVFLTKAQEELIISFYSGKNSFADSFEKTEEVRRYLSSLIKTYVTTEKKTGYIGLSKTSTFFELPDDLWFITYESVILKDSKLDCTEEEEAVVVPILQDEYFNISNNPFRRSSKKRVLRLDNGNKISEIISEYNIDRYIIRYIIKPNPIILTDLPEGLFINSINTETECELNPVIHRTILERAVNLAKLAFTK